jgi:uncharacterized membrane protein (UPF0127 family)
MRIVNETKNLAVSEDAKFAHSFFTRALGLMLSKKKDLVLVSPKEDIISSTIHMMLMRYPIDVVWVNSEKIVVEVALNVPPFNLLRPDTWGTYAPCKPAKYVIELGKGGAGKTERGDRMTFLCVGAEAFHEAP